MAVVLVVNDHAEMLDTYESLLASMGHEAVTKMAIDSGPETVRQVGADALLVDLQRPDEDAYGVRIIEELRSHPETTNVPIILCTGDAEAARPLIPHLDRMGVPVVLKPFAVEELEVALQAALGTPRGR